MIQIRQGPDLCRRKRRDRRSKTAEAHLGVLDVAQAHGAETSAQKKSLGANTPWHRAICPRHKLRNGAGKVPKIAGAYQRPSASLPSAWRRRTRIRCEFGNEMKPLRLNSVSERHAVSEVGPRWSPMSTSIIGKATQACVSHPSWAAIRSRNDAIRSCAVIGSSTNMRPWAS